MKKISLLIPLIVMVNLAYSQVKTAIYQKRTVKVFPYRIQVDESESATGYDYYDDYNYQVTESVFNKYVIPYCPEKLEDGEYIVYYKPEIDANNYEKSMAQFAKGDTLFVAIHFFIKNQVKEGKVSFYDRRNLKKEIVVGNYNNDDKAGIWNYIYEKNKVSSEFKKGKLDGKTTITYKKVTIVKNFKAGLQDGVEQSFIGKRLVEYQTYKEGFLYGLYQRENNITTKGFHLSYDRDSFTNVYKKGKLLYAIINSPTPFMGADTSEGIWFIDFTSLKKTDEKIAPYTFQSKKIYSHYFSISKEGKRINDFYLVDKKIKIPFVLLDENGDTLIETKRIENNDSFLKFNMVVNTYESKQKLKSKTVSIVTSRKFYEYEGTIYNIFQMNGGLFNEEKKILETTYNKSNIERQFQLNKPLPEYKGWVIKTDSTVYLNKKTGVPEYSFEHFEIKGINKTYTSYRSFRGAFYESLWPDLNITMLHQDTLVVREKSEISKGLDLYNTMKICFKDSSIIQTDNNLVNLYHLIHGEYYGKTYSGVTSNILEYNGKPYTGSIQYTLKHSTKVKPYEIDLTLKKKNETLFLLKLERKEKKIKVFFRRFSYKMRHLFKLKRQYDTDVVEAIYDNGPKFEAKDVFPPTYYFEFKNGKLHGSQRAYTKNGLEIYSLNFKNGYSHGSQWYSLSYSPDFTSTYALSQLNFDSARLHGYVHLLQNNGQQPKLFAKYNKGKLNGSYIKFNETYHEFYPEPEIEANFVNDTLNGEVLVSSIGLVKEKIPFVNGNVNGKYVKNLVRVIDESESDSVHNYKSYIVYYKELEAKFHDGKVKDSIIGYFEHGAIKFIALVDTDFHHTYMHQLISPKGMVTIMKNRAYFKDTLLEKELYYPQLNYGGTGNEYIQFGIETYDDGSGLDFDPIYDHPKAKFTFYYKNGLKSQEGKMVNGVKYRTWKYWNEDGVLMKEIEYKPGMDSSTENTIYYKGKITAYYPDGKKLLEGLITDEELSYQCNQELEVAYEDVYFLKYYDKDGNQILDKLSGIVSDYHLNGNKRYTGQITRGLKTGLWKYYDPTGNLTAIGEYADNQKQGKWLEGDLGGINYLDNACSVNEALSLLKELQLKDIEITETIYEMGAVISTSHLVLEKF